MALPTKMTLTPQATYTVAEGESTDASSEFWQRISSNRAIIYTGVPYALAQNILQSSDPDTAIATQLAGYPKRVAAIP